MIDYTLDIAAKVQRVFPYAKSDDIKRNLPCVIEALNSAGIGTRPMLLMALGTIAAETNGFKPISEYPSKYNTAPGGKPFALYDLRRDIGNGAPGDGALYKGRGFVQLTGKFNYEKFGRQLGLDLINNPDLANDRDVAARILAAFLVSQKTRITNALEAGDLKQARKLVNGGSHGLDAFTKAYKLADSLLPK